MKAKREEEILEKRFGEKYSTYKQSVPRFMFANPLRALRWSRNKSIFATIVTFLFLINLGLSLLLTGYAIFKLIEGEPTFLQIWK